MLLNIHGVSQQPSAREVYNIPFINCFKHKRASFRRFVSNQNTHVISMHGTNELFCYSHKPLGVRGESTYRNADGGRDSS